MTVWLITAIYLVAIISVNINVIQGIICFIMATLLMAIWEGKGLEKKEATGYCKLINDRKQYPSWQI